MKTRRAMLAAAAAALGLAASPAWAETACKLNKLAELPITMVGPRPTVPVKINGHEAPFFIDSGAEFGTIDLSWAKRLDVHDQVAPGATLNGVGGTQTLRFARIKDFDLSDLPLHNIDFFVAESGLEGRSRGWWARTSWARWTPNTTLPTAWCASSSRKTATANSWPTGPTARPP